MSKARRSKSAASSPRSTLFSSRRLWSTRKDNWPRTLPFTPRRNPISRAFKRLVDRIRSPCSKLPTRSFWLRRMRRPRVIKSDQTQLDYTTLRAPFDGVTGILQIQIGNLIQPSNTTGIVANRVPPDKVPSSGSAKRGNVSRSGLREMDTDFCKLQMSPARTARRREHDFDLISARAHKHSERAGRRRLPSEFSCSSRRAPFPGPARHRHTGDCCRPRRFAAAHRKG